MLLLHAIVAALTYQQVKKKSRRNWREEEEEGKRSRGRLLKTLARERRVGGLGRER